MESPVVNAPRFVSPVVYSRFTATASAIAVVTVVSVVWILFRLETSSVPLIAAWY